MVANENRPPDGYDEDEWLDFMADTEPSCTGFTRCHECHLFGKDGCTIQDTVPRCFVEENWELFHE